MNVCQSLICFFFLTLQDGNIGLINAEIIKSTGTEGGNITVRCSFTSSGKRRIFCKDECKDGDILIETEEDTAQIGRYSIECIEGGFPVSKIIVYVSIRNLTQSDSGRSNLSSQTFFTISPISLNTDDITDISSKFRLTFMRTALHSPPVQTPPTRVWIQPPGIQTTSTLLSLRYNTYDDVSKSFC
ncbi:hypothetical protein EPR50_G00071850 [Perca flavescens]|uniref:Immunoglobulin subtype domain-containing protein n=1 Tax=Perca flavescens TaxID=8167 RepID=A0A484D426_PERFV|nr:hypothetical protein EPR50_G00071850 [Perca flavescens]